MVSDFPANPLVAIQVPGYKLKLAEKNEIELRILAPGLTTVFTEQTKFVNGDRSQPYSVYGTEKEVPVIRRAGKTYIEIVPLQLGEFELEVAGVFPPRRVFVKRVNLVVGLSTHHPEKLIISQTGLPGINAGVVTTTLPCAPEASGCRPYRSIFRLFATARYPDVENVAQISAGFLSFRAKNSGDGPVIRINDTNGVVTPLRVGHALVETYFEGLTNRTCVVVEADARVSGRLSDCDDLLSPGEKIDFQ
jgi:hypothetical protein